MRQIHFGFFLAMLCIAESAHAATILFTNIGGNGTPFDGAVSGPGTMLLARQF